MTAIRLPLSGDVTQTFNINVGESSNPDIERDALCKASYGMQLGRIGEALLVLLRYADMPLDKLHKDERQAIDDLKHMLTDIANVKERHHARHILRP